MFRVGLISCAVSTVGAVPMLSFDAGGDVDGVTGLEVGGVTFDASWTVGSFDAVGQNPPLLSNMADASSLAVMISTLFNNNNITAEDVAGVSCTNDIDCDLVVSYNVNASTVDAVNVDWNASVAMPPGNWGAQVQTWARSFTSDQTAQVSITTVPQISEPGILALTGIGLIGFAFARKRITA